jgi:hypothetical protein
MASVERHCVSDWQFQHTPPPDFDESIGHWVSIRNFIVFIQDIACRILAVPESALLTLFSNSTQLSVHQLQKSYNKILTQIVGNGFSAAKQEILPMLNLSVRQPIGQLSVDQLRMLNYVVFTASTTAAVLDNFYVKCEETYPK